MKRHESLEKAVGVEIHSDSTPERNEIELRVRGELADLPLREREALEAFVKISGESCRSIAHRRNVSVQTVCNWARKAADKVRPHLEGCL